jgi:hypothetical protein
MSLVIDVYDNARHEWRYFTVVPYTSYRPACGNGLHQFAPYAKQCACGGVQR